MRVFQRCKPHSRVWGRHSPTRFPQGQNRRYADFGTVVESCSEKLPLSLCAAAFNTYKTEEGQKDGKSGGFFPLPLLQFAEGVLAGFRKYSDCGGVFCPLFAALHDRNGEMPNASLDFFITTTVAPCRSSKYLRCSFRYYYGTQARFWQTSPSLPTTAG